MRFNKEVAAILVKSDQFLQKIVRRDGSIHVELHKALYGLKTAGREWYNLICKKLQGWGYKRSINESCLFTKGSTKIALYVDDLLVIDADSRKIDELQTLLKKELKEITVIDGPKISFLGMSIERSRSGGYIISHQSHADEISREYATTDYRTPKSPANANTKGSNPTSEAFDPSRYRSEVMKFLYLATRTRPNLLYATAVLASRTNSPTKDDFDKLSRLAQYVHVTASDSIRFSSEGEFETSGYACKWAWLISAIYPIEGRLLCIEIGVYEGNYTHFKLEGVGSISARIRDIGHR